MQGFTAQKRLWNFPREKILREGGALPKEGVREYKAMHDWFREDGREKEQGRLEMSDENEEERCEKSKREGEKEENETESVKRRYDGFVSVEVFEIFSHGGVVVLFLGGSLG